jgi:hypothetical protein
MARSLWHDPDRRDGAISDAMIEKQSDNADAPGPYYRALLPPAPVAAAADVIMLWFRDSVSEMLPMGVPKGPSEGGTGGKRGHSGMEHWMTTEETNEAAKRRRRLEDKDEVREQEANHEPTEE